MASRVLPGILLFLYQTLLTLKSVVAALIVFYSFPKVNDTAAGSGSSLGEQEINLSLKQPELQRFWKRGSNPYPWRIITSH